MVKNFTAEEKAIILKQDYLNATTELGKLTIDFKNFHFIKKN